MNTLTEFIKDKLTPAMYDCLDVAIPSMDFKKVGKDWHSRHRLSGEETTRKDRTVVTTDVPSRALENGEGSRTISLVDLYLSENGYSTSLQGKELVEALRPLCETCRVQIPELDSEGYKADKDRQDRLELLASKMRRELWTTDGGRAVLDYLRNGREYTDETIKAMELGYCSEETARELFSIHAGARGLGTEYTLAIPYRSGGTLKGFKVRSILPDTDKANRYKNTTGLDKKGSLFGLTGLKLTGNGAKDRDITIVEGELDALHAKILGATNVVGLAGLAVSSEAIEEAKNKGVKRITVLVDYEETEKERTAKLPTIEKAIRTITKAGLTPLVAELPARADGKKEDTDSFLRTHSVEELQKIIDEAIRGSKWKFLQILANTQKNTNEKGDIQDKGFDEYKEQIIELILDEELCTPVDRDLILAYYSQTTKDVITKDAIDEVIALREADKAKERQSKETKELLKKASKLAEEGRTAEALSLISGKVEEAKEIDKDSKYRNLLALPTEKSLLERLRTRPEGIETDYLFTSGMKRARLVLPSGGLTLVGAPTSHGKSTFLRNLALDIAKRDGEGSVLYFTLEEDYESTVYELVNTFANKDITTPTRDYNNLTTIAEYYTKGTTQYMRSGARDYFLEREATFRRDYLQSGKIRIYDYDYYSNEVVEAIASVSRSIKVKAVFIDYAQLLYKQGNKAQRNEELKEIAKDLRQTAKALKLPIVLACQLNRDAKSPTEMFSQNIADSADLEREANVVVLLWNGTFRPLNNNTYKENDLEEGKRMILGRDEKIYAKLAKNRGGQASLDCVLDFNGNTGYITPNYVAPLEAPEDTDRTPVEVDI